VYCSTTTPLPKRRFSTSSRPRRTPSEESLSAANDHGADDHLELVDKTGPYRLRGEFRTVNSDVVLGAGLEPPNRVGVELPLDPRPRATRSSLLYAQCVDDAFDLLDVRSFMVCQPLGSGELEFPAA
jgi:hypothetical protein